MSAVYIVLYNATTLWDTIGLIGVVMACYDRKSKFADGVTSKLVLFMTILTYPRTVIDSSVLLRL
jgi:hypothetical protein